MIQECARTGCLKRENIYGLAVMDTGRLDKVSSAEENMKLRSPGAVTHSMNLFPPVLRPSCSVPFAHLSAPPPRRVFLR